MKRDAKGNGRVVARVTAAVKRGEETTKME